MFCSVAAGYPKLQPYVNDFAHLLTADQISRLNADCANIEKETTAEIVIVTVTTTDGEDRTLYANHLGEESGVGKAAKDNGVVVLWSIDEGGAIAVGRGIEGTLNDAKVGRIGKNAKPLFNNKSYYEGFTKIITDIRGEISGNITATPNETPPDIPLWVIILIVIFIIIIVAASDSGSGGSWGGSSYVGHSSWGSSGSGGSFGGGSFGGGGASF